MYTSGKVNPSKAANVCTHIQAISSDPTKRDACAAITDKTTCNGNTDCQWTPGYGIKYEKGTCDKPELEIPIESPLASYTEESCDNACLLLGNCVDFSIGRTNEADNGKCKLYA